MTAPRPLRALPCPGAWPVPRGPAPVVPAGPVGGVVGPGVRGAGGGVVVDMTAWCCQHGCMKTVSLRLDEALLSRFDEYAKRQRRSVNAQLVRLIEETLQEDAPFLNTEPFNIPCPTCRARAGIACVEPTGDRPARVICAERIQVAALGG